MKHVQQISIQYLKGEKGILHFSVFNEGVPRMEDLQDLLEIFLV